MATRDPALDPVTTKPQELDGLVCARGVQPLSVVRSR
jgi:hypothetical protein